MKHLFTNRNRGTIELIMDILDLLSQHIGTPIRPYKRHGGVVFTTLQSTCNIEYRTFMSLQNLLSTNNIIEIVRNTTQSRLAILTDIEETKSYPYGSLVHITPKGLNALNKYKELLALFEKGTK